MGECELMPSPEQQMPNAAARCVPQLFIGFRVAVRIAEAAAAWRLGITPLWPVIAAAVLFAVLDLRLAALTRPGSGWRLMLLLAADTCDISLWTFILGGSAGITVCIAVPAAALWAVRHGPRSLVVPAVTASATWLTLQLDGRPPTPIAYLWPTLAACLGMLTVHCLGTHWHHEQAMARWRIDADAAQAELSGQNSVAMGADSVIDLLSRTYPLLAAYTERPLPSPFAAWKAALADRCGRDSAYLGTVLLRWKHAYNRFKPDLASDVQLRLPPGAGTLLLSPLQEEALIARLERMRPHGELHISVPAFEPVGQRQTVIVSGEPITLEADRLPAVRPFDAAPMLLTCGAVVTAAHTVLDGVPVAVAAPLAAALLGCAWLFRCTVPLTSRERRRAMLAVALVLAASDAIAAGATAHPPMFDHGVGLPFLNFLDWFAPLVAYYARDLTTQRWAALALVTAVASGAGARLFTGPVGLAAALSALAWPLFGAIAAAGAREAVESDWAVQSERFAARHQAAVWDAWRRGRREVLEMTADAAAEMRTRYEAARGFLPEGIAEELDGRLTAAQARVAWLSSSAVDHVATTAPGGFRTKESLTR